MPEFKTPSITGVYFEDTTGKLRLFEKDSILVMTVQPLPRAWQKTRRKSYWINCRPERFKIPMGNIEKRLEGLNSHLDENGKLLPQFCTSPTDKFLNLGIRSHLMFCLTISKKDRLIIRPFPTRQWHLLSLLAGCGDAAVELVESNPTLGFMVSSSWVFKKKPVQKPLRAARSIVNKKQRDILRWLDWPNNSESTRKILAKIAHPAINISNLLYLRQAICDKKIAKTLCHLPRINTGVLRIVTDPGLSSLTTPSLLFEIAHCRKHEDKYPTAAYLLRDSIHIQLQLYANRRFPGPIRHLKQLSEVHDSLVEDLNCAKSLNENIPFPAPPIDGTEFIRPITQTADLVREGIFMKNCVAADLYITKILQREIYIYQVFKPERCTLALKRKNGAWTVSELKRARNEDPASITRSAVEIWLAQKPTNNGRGQM